MGKKSETISGIVESLRGREFDPHYLGYFECFNRQLFFEAHEVLEVLWLPERGRPRDLFYKGLIQLAGAFVHLQKHRRRPAAALLRLARANLSQYPAIYEGLQTAEVLEMIESWLTRVAPVASVDDLLSDGKAPRLRLPTTVEVGPRLYNSQPAPAVV
jgi:hypothetical protein